MSNKEAKVKISIKDGTFELTGSELFVTQQIENFKQLIFSSFEEFKNSDPDETEIDNSNVPGPDAAPSQKPDKSNPYPNVLHIEENNVKVLKQMPGNTISQKAINTALVYLWGWKRIGLDLVSFGDIRELCKEHSCLDSKNFAAHMKSARQYIIIEGLKSSSSKTCKLTIPGVDKAKELLDTMNV